MSNQNVFELFTTDPVQYNMQNLKTKLVLVLMNLIRQKGWTQAVAARELRVSQPRISNLFKGQLDKFSIDTMMEMLVRLGYKLDADFDPTDSVEPLVLKCKKALL